MNANEFAVALTQALQEKFAGMTVEFVYPEGQLPLMEVSWNERPVRGHGFYRGSFDNHDIAAYAEMIARAYRFTHKEQDEQA